MQAEYAIPYYASGMAQGDGSCSRGGLMRIVNTPIGKPVRRGTESPPLEVPTESPVEAPKVPVPA